MTSVGIYRVSATSVSLQKYRVAINAEPAVNHFTGEVDDVNIVAGLLKQYFRELADPLLTFKLYDGFISAARKSG